MPASEKSALARVLQGLQGFVIGGWKGLLLMGEHASAGRLLLQQQCQVSLLVYSIREYININ